MLKLAAHFSHYKSGCMVKNKRRSPEEVFTSPEHPPPLKFAKYSPPPQSLLLPDPAYVSLQVKNYVAPGITYLICYYAFSNITLGEGSLKGQKHIEQFLQAGDN